MDDTGIEPASFDVEANVRANTTNHPYTNVCTV